MCKSSLSGYLSSDPLLTWYAEWYSMAVSLDQPVTLALGNSVSAPDYPAIALA